MQRVIMEFDVDFCRPIEYPLIDPADFFPTATQTAKGIGHGDLIRPRPVAAHGAEVAGVEGAVKAYECIQRGMTAYQTFFSGNRSLNGCVHNLPPEDFSSPRRNNATCVAAARRVSSRT